MSDFAAALIFPQWQGAGSRKGYAAGTTFLETLIPDDLPRAWVHCANDDLSTEDGVKGLGDLVAQAETAQHLLAHLPPGPILTLGGDCAADLMPILHARDAQEDPLALVYIDAHADLNAAAESPSGHFHGMVVRALLGEAPAAFAPLIATPLRPEQLFYVSARERDPAEDQAIAARKLFRLVDGAPYDRLAGELQRQGYRRIYLHLDLDVLDPAVFPFIGVPAQEGWPIAKLIEFLAAFRRDFEIAGAAITELSLAQPDAARLAEGAMRQILEAGFGLQSRTGATNAG
ncbi:arginase family protein [Dongia sp.]|uniref:arginase family protein n=1 Tax=Dongia sp. TaxID=1977262 RepID=UPI0035B1912A